MDQNILVDYGKKEVMLCVLCAAYSKMGVLLMDQLGVNKKFLKLIWKHEKSQENMKDCIFCFI